MERQPSGKKDNVELEVQRTSYTNKVLVSCFSVSCDTASEALLGLQIVFRERGHLGEASLKRRDNLDSEIELLIYLFGYEPLFTRVKQESRK